MATLYTNSKQIIVYLLLFAVTFCLIFQGTQSIWSSHLESDTYAYEQRAIHLYTYHNLKDLGPNEYQPGAIIFFTAVYYLHILSGQSLNYNFTFIIVNVWLMLLFGLIYKKFGLINLFYFELILLFTGAIILYRFELLVSLLILLAFISLKKGYQKLGVVLLSLATFVKVFPVILVPFFLLYIWKNDKSIIKSLYISTYYFLALFIMLILYTLAFQPNASDIVYSLNFHLDKPVHSESLWGTLLTLWSKLTTGTYALGEGSNGIFGIAREYILIPIKYYNYIWLIPYVLILLGYFIIFKKISFSIFVRICLIVILFFITFSKVFTPQYFLWFTLLVPLLSRKILISFRWRINILLMILIALLHQYIYPLNYLNWILFYTNGIHEHLFWINTLRNFLLIVLALRLLIELINHLRVYNLKNISS